MDETETVGSGVDTGTSVSSIIDGWHGLCQLTTQIASNGGDTLDLTLIEGDRLKMTLTLTAITANFQPLDLPDCWNATDGTGREWVAVFTDTDELTIRDELFTGLKWLAAKSSTRRLIWDPTAPAWARLLQFDLLELPTLLRPHFDQLLVAMDVLRRNLHSKQEAARVAHEAYINAGSALNEACTSLERRLTAAAKVSESMAEFESLGLSLTCTIARWPVVEVAPTAPNCTPPKRTTNRRGYVDSRTLQRWIRQAGCRATTDGRRAKRGDYLTVLQQLTAAEIERMSAAERAAVAERFGIKLLGRTVHYVAARIRAVFQSLE